MGLRPLRPARPPGGELGIDRDDRVVGTQRHRAVLHAHRFYHARMTSTVRHGSCSRRAPGDRSPPARGAPRAARRAVGVRCLAATAADAAADDGSHDVRRPARPAAGHARRGELLGIVVHAVRDGDPRPDRGTPRCGDKVRFIGVDVQDNRDGGDRLHRTNSACRTRASSTRRTRSRSSYGLFSPPDTLFFDAERDPRQDDPRADLRRRPRWRTCEAIDRLSAGPLVPLASYGSRL